MPAEPNKRGAAAPLIKAATGTVGNGTAAVSDAQTEPADIRREQPVKDYADLRGPSLLKRTLGLQNHRHSSLAGPTSLYESRLLRQEAVFRLAEDVALGGAGAASSSALRRVGESATFVLTPDVGTRNHDQEMDDLDSIESLVAPHGSALISLYFRIVHPTFPILHKKVFLEKYERTHREFSPPLLAAVYILALNWWSYSAELSMLQPKPDAKRLEEIAFKTMGDIVHRPKLSTIQAGLLLLQRPEGDSWALTSQLVGLGQDLGLHLDCTDWRIPAWEKGLRKRLAWALYMQDKWGSLVHGRPSHIMAADWDVMPLEESDFPERAADEDEEEGSTEVEKGRVLFCEMISLTQILADVLLNFYTGRAEAELRNHAASGVGWVLQRAKPLQLRLKSWFTDLPECLRLQEVTMRKLSSAGYLHLAYYAAEITLHRRIVHALEAEEQPELVHVCQLAARERLVNALDFVNRLRPEHLQSFWYSASTYNFALVGTFISLLWATAGSADDAAFYKNKLDEYRWSLRLSSKNAEILERAIALMTTSTGVLVKALPAKFTAFPVLNMPGTNVTVPGDTMSGGAPGSASDTASIQLRLESDMSATSDDTGILSPTYDDYATDEALPLDTSHMPPWFADTGAFGTPTATSNAAYAGVVVVADAQQNYIGYQGL
jgi:hypothetical protein